jgi:hypothetical protein
MLFRDVVQRAANGLKSFQWVAQVIVATYWLPQVLSMGGRSFLLMSTGHRFVSDSDLDNVVSDIRSLGHIVPSTSDLLVDVSDSLRNPDGGRRGRVPPAWCSKDTRKKALMLDWRCVGGLKVCNM